MGVGGGEDYLQLFTEETTFYNHIVLGNLLPSSWWINLPHFVQTWLRNYIAGSILYFASAFLWCFYIYYLKRNVYLPKGNLGFLDFAVDFDLMCNWWNVLLLDLVFDVGLLWLLINNFFFYVVLICFMLVAIVLLFFYFMNLVDWWISCLKTVKCSFLLYDLYSGFQFHGNIFSVINKLFVIILAFGILVVLTFASPNFHLFRFTY